MAKEEGGSSGMPGTLGLLIVAGGVLLVIIVLRDLAGLGGLGQPGVTSTEGAVKYSQQVNQIPGVQQTVQNVSQATSGQPGPYGYVTQVGQGNPSKGFFCQYFGIGC